MRLLRSLSFRLAIIYSVVFTISFGALLTAYYWMNVWGPLRAMEREVRDESDVLATRYRDGGEAALISLLERRAEAKSERYAFHALVAPDGRTLTANLPSWPETSRDSWFRLKVYLLNAGTEQPLEALVYDRRLADGSRLLVGRDIEDLNDLQEATGEAAIWIIAGAILLSIAGGALISIATGRRIAAVSDAALRVVGGNLSGRLPVRGTDDDFDRLSKTLNLMLMRIEGLVESVQRISDSVAHELRTPLTRLHATLTSLKQTGADVRSQLLDDAIGEAERLRNIFDAVSRIAGIESGVNLPEKRDIDLSMLLNDAAEFYLPAAEGHSISLETDVASDLRVLGNADLLFQAISNLLDNAVKYTPAGGTVQLSAGVRDGYVWINVSDTGPGIPVEEHERVFERFYRVANNADVQGLGLGLSLVSAVAALHGSKIGFSNNHPGLKVEWMLAISPRSA